RTDSIAPLIRGARDKTAAQFQITVPDLLLQACRESSLAWKAEGRLDRLGTTLRTASGRLRFRPVCRATGNQEAACAVE
ncbi:Uncharacterized protein DBV15_08248, partial [Temnothorax longispinosus]